MSRAFEVAGAAAPLLVPSQVRPALHRGAQDIDGGIDDAEHGLAAEELHIAELFRLIFLGVKDDVGVADRAELGEVGLQLLASQVWRKVRDEHHLLFLLFFRSLLFLFARGDLAVDLPTGDLVAELQYLRDIHSISQRDVRKTLRSSVFFMLSCLALVLEFLKTDKISAIQLKKHTADSQIL